MCKKLVVILIAPKLNVVPVVEIVWIVIAVKEVLVVPTLKIVEVQLPVGKLHLKQSTSFAETSVLLCSWKVPNVPHTARNLPGAQIDHRLQHVRSVPLQLGTIVVNAYLPLAIARLAELGIVGPQLVAST